MNTCLPPAVVFVRYGAQLGARSKYTKEAEAVIRATREKEGNGDMYGARKVSSGEVTMGKEESQRSEQGINEDDDSAICSRLDDTLTFLYLM